MKKSILLSMGFIAISVCNAYAYCTDWGDANMFYSTEAKLKAACSESSWLGAQDCATLDMSLTFVVKSDDGSCEYVPSCATCPSGYRLNSEAMRYDLGEACYIGDGNEVNGFDQGILDAWPMEYYVCESMPTACAAGYWGVNSDSCDLCPICTGVYTNPTRTTLVRGTSIAGKNSSVYDCFISPGTYYDVTGTFEMDDYCSM